MSNTKQHKTSEQASIDFESLLPVVIWLDELRFSSPLSEADAAELRGRQRHFAEITYGRKIPPKRFKSDGCTLSPDHFGKRCCVLHDLAYWLGGTRQERLATDRRVRHCTCHQPVKFAKQYAPLQYAGVRVFGHPNIPWHLVGVDARWGFGWDYPSPGEPGTVY